MKEKQGREGKEERRREREEWEWTSNGRPYLSTQEQIFVLLQLCLHSPADDGSGVDLDGLLALTSRE